MGLIKAWYNHPKCKVKVDGQLLLHSLSSEAYFRDLLSPVLFLLVMDPLLRELEESKLGPSISGIYAGAYTHADDIQCSKQREYILLFGTNLCISSKLHHLCLKKVDRNIL